MKIAIYGVGHIGEYIWNILQKRKHPPEIVYFVRTTKNQESFHGIKIIRVEDICYDDFDYLVIAGELRADEMLATLKNLHNGYDEHKDKVVKFDAYFPYDYQRVAESIEYYSCRVESDIVYIGRQDDRCIPVAMSWSGENWSGRMIDWFFELTKKYYPESTEHTDGYFLDIGANIGTTSIYVEKKICQPLKIIGFEPGQSNYDLFRVNCILNHTTNITTEMLGLSDVNQEMRYCYTAYNSGASHLVEDDDKSASADSIVKVVRLDDYLAEHQISPEEINYIWIDAEGHEGRVLSGAMNTLQRKKIPLIQEFNPGTYSKTYYHIMQKTYSSFIRISDYINKRERIYPISELSNSSEWLSTPQDDLFFF